MRKYYYLAYDIFCICSALIAALYLRHGFPLIQEGQPEDLYLLVLTTLFIALCLLPLMRTHTSMWRFTSSSELGGVMIAVTLIVLVMNSALFLTSRLEMMPRSVPPMHWALAVVMMGGSRILARTLFGPARKSATHQALLKQHVIVIGACHTAELYLQFIKRIVQHEVVVVGLVDSDATLTRRLFQKHEIMGTPADIPRLIEQFLVHGIEIKQLILAHMFDDLSESEQSILVGLMDSGAMDLVHFGKHMSPQWSVRASEKVADFYQDGHAISRDDEDRKSVV